jgi:hypothetical protein
MKMAVGTLTSYPGAIIRTRANYGLVNPYYEIRPYSVIALDTAGNVFASSLTHQESYNMWLHSAIFETLRTGSGPRSCSRTTAPPRRNRSSRSLPFTPRLETEVSLRKFRSLSGSYRSLRRLRSLWKDQLIPTCSSTAPYCSVSHL